MDQMKVASSLYIGRGTLLIDPLAVSRPSSLLSSIRSLLPDKMLARRHEYQAPGYGDVVKPSVRPS